MKKVLSMATILFLAFLSTSAFMACFVFAEQEITDDMFYSARYILILKSTTDYNVALRFANESSKKLGLELKIEDIEYSKEKGICFSKDIDDELYKGEYAPRRYCGDYISLENSSAYEGFVEGYIVVIAGIYQNKDDAELALRDVKESYPDAYVKKTNLWMGCIH